MKTALLSITLLAILLAAPTQADRGSIPFNPKVKIYEPTQTAMIAWNGKEEILILVTDMRASDSTKVLEVLPLPSEPSVTEGDEKVFDKATSLINRKLQMQYARDIDRMVAKKGDVPQAGRITFHERIGAHDIAVAEVQDKDKFVDWVNDYLTAGDVADPEIPDDMESIVKDYLKENFKWFVFDIVDLDQTPKTNDAIQYRFKTDFLYYPLRITKTEEGRTTVKIFVLTKDLLLDFTGVDYDDVQLMHEPVTIGTREVMSLSEEINEMFHSDNELTFRIWQITGRLSRFDKDLIVK